MEHQIYEYIIIYIYIYVNKSLYVYVYINYGCVGSSTSIPYIKRLASEDWGTQHTDANSESQHEDNIRGNTSNIYGGVFHPPTRNVTVILCVV